MKEQRTQYFNLVINNIDVKNKEVTKFASYDFFHLGVINLDMIKNYVSPETFSFFEKFKRIRVSPVMDIGKSEIIYKIETQENIVAMDMVFAILELYRTNGIVIKDGSFFMERYSLVKEIFKLT